MHISLDGFVAGPKGELNWAKVNEELFAYVGQRIQKGETALYGRNTYQMMESYWPTAAERANASQHDIEHSKWYNSAHKIVLSKTLQESNLKNTNIISDNIAEKIKQIKSEAGREILIFGSPGATHALLDLNLIDGFWLFVNPILLGEGIPLFKNIKPGVVLNRLPETRQFENGVVELNYEIDRTK